MDEHPAVLAFENGSNILTEIFPKLKVSDVNPEIVKRTRTKSVPNPEEFVPTKDDTRNNPNAQSSNRVRFQDQW